MKAEPGIRRTGSGWQVYVRIAGEFRSKHFPPDTELIDLRRWREQQKARHTLNLPALSDSPGLKQDVRTYLSLVTNLATYENRAYQMQWWLTFLGDKPRDEVTTLDVRHGLKQLERHGASPATRNLYRTALRHFYRTLNGRGGYNPVIDTPREPEPPKRLTLPTWPTAKRAIAAINVPAHRARLTVLLYTGWPSAQLKRLNARDINHKNLTVYLEGRKKGKGTSGVTLPILPQASRALKSCPLGPFSNNALYVALQYACKKAEIPPFRVYDLRHLFLTTAALAIRDDRAVQALALHHPRTITARYTEQSVDARVRDGLKKLQTYLRVKLKDK